MLGLLDRGLSLTEDIVPVVRSKAGKRFATWDYVVAACLEAYGARTSAANIVILTPPARASPGQSAARAEEPPTHNPFVAAGLAKYFRDDPDDLQEA